MVRAAVTTTPETKRPETTVPGRNVVSQVRSPVGYRPPFFAGLAAGFGFAAPAGLTGAGAGFGLVAIFICLSLQDLLAADRFGRRRHAIAL